jgi:hypothetical protein
MLRMTGVWMCVVLGCSPPSSEVSAKPRPKPIAPAPAPTSSATSTLPAPAATPLPTMLAKPLPARPPRKLIKRAGIQITEAADGQVTLKTTAKWGEAIDSTYADCGFYLAAVPVLTEQLSASHAKLLSRVCVSAAQAAKPAR